MDTGNLRACHSCSLIKSLDEFYENGCDNCKYRGEAARTRTSPNFNGYVLPLREEGRMNGLLAYWHEG